MSMSKQPRVCADNKSYLYGMIRGLSVVVLCAGKTGHLAV